MQRFFQKEPALKFIPLGGAGTVTKNMFVYEYADDILIVDCGIGFPEAEQLGVDVIIPDISYLRDKIHKIRGITITHAHEDHFGALPYLISDLGKPPIYAAKLPGGFIQNKLAEFDLLQGQSLRLIEPETDPFELGVFRITPVRVNHSVPDALALFIETPVGNFVHAADFKFDWTPVDQKQFEIKKLATLCQKGVLSLMSDCLGATTAGYTASEKDIQVSFEREIKEAPSQVFITTVSSNISRIQQAINASLSFNRKVAVLGRSLNQSVEIAQKLGYLEIPQGALTSLEEAEKLPRQFITYLVAGSYGQPNSALVRLSKQENKEAKLEKEAVVIFSADPIPGVYDQVGKLIDRLTELGARVVYSEIQDDLHVSGHGLIGDLQMMVGVSQPAFFVPIGGSLRHLRAYKKMVAKMGFNQECVFELKEGEVLEFSKGRAQRGKKVGLQAVFVDGSVVGDVGNKVLQDRLRLSKHGIFVVIVKKMKDGHFSNSVDIVSRGFVYMAESEKLVAQAASLVSKLIRDRSVKDWGKLKKEIEEKLSRFLYRQTEREPMILAVLVDGE